MDTSLHMHTSRGKLNHSTTSSSSSTNVPAVYTNAHSQSGQIIHQIPAFPSHPWPGNAISLAGLSGQMQEIPPGTHIVQASGSGPHIITASPSAILSLNMTPAGNLVATVPAAAAPQVQPDPNDANKWHITFTTPSSLENGEGEGSGKRKVRGVACTCPNCRDGEGRDIPSKKKLHACHIPGCNKVYGQTSHLRAHIRWHTGERPFVCNWLACGKRFTRSDELQRHRRSHTGEKGFQCPHCCKRFMKNDNLVKHIQTHQLDIGYRHQQSET